MAIIYGPNMARLGVARRLMPTILMKAYTTHRERSDVFLSYQHKDQDTALTLAKELSGLNLDVFIDIYDDTLFPGDTDLDDALVEAITNAATMLIVVSDDTQDSWWVPWEIGVSTPSGTPKAMYKPRTNRRLPKYPGKLKRLENPILAAFWIILKK